MTTQTNGINYYVADKFYESYKKPKDLEEVSLKINKVS